MQAVPFELDHGVNYFSGVNRRQMKHNGGACCPLILTGMCIRFGDLLHISNSLATSIRQHLATVNNNISD